MAQYTFTVQSFMGNGPSATAPVPTDEKKDLYASILCLCESGQDKMLLELKYLRPDTREYLDSIGRVRRPEYNAYDPLKKVGVAYFNAFDFEWHLSMLRSGKLIKAQVDDEYPAGNRIFFDLTMPTPTQSAAPDVDEWLDRHPNVRAALQWHELNGPPPDYDSWPAQKREEFRQAFAKAWNHEPFGLEDPPPNLVDYGAEGTVFDLDHAWGLFSAHIAQSLAAEIGHWVPWSITSCDDPDLARLFDSSSMFDRRGIEPAGYSLVYRGVPPSPDLA